MHKLIIAIAISMLLATSADFIVRDGIANISWEAPSDESVVGYNVYIRERGGELELYETLDGISSTECEYPYTEEEIGKVIWIRVYSFNSLGWESKKYISCSALLTSSAEPDKLEVR